MISIIVVTTYLAYKLTLPGPDAAELALAANQETVNRVGELIILPENELPKIVVMTELNIPKDQIFFDNAEVGDQLILYPLARRAILYSPKLDKSKEAGPLSITPKAPTSDIATTESLN